MRPTVIILVVVGVLILAGYVVVGVEVARRAMGSRETETAGPQADPVGPLALPEGVRVIGMVATADRVVLHVKHPDGPDRIVVLDPKAPRLDSGSVTGAIK